jgi:hypothetical protein
MTGKIVSSLVKEIEMTTNLFMIFSLFVDIWTLQKKTPEDMFLANGQLLQN